MEGFFIKILFNELKRHKISLIIILILTYISTLFELLIPILLANAINIGIVKNYGLKYIQNITLMMLMIMLFTIVTNTLISYLTNRVSIYTSSNIKNILFEKVLSIKENEELSSSTLFTRTTQDINQIKGFTSSFLSIIFKAPLIFINSIAILKTLNNNFSIILLISIIILIIFLIIISVKIYPLSKQIQIKTDNLIRYTKEKIEGIKIIKSYNKIKEYDNKYKKENKQYLSLLKKTIKFSSSILPILNFLVNSCIIIIILISIKLFKNNNIEIGTIMATIQYILQILLSIIMFSMVIILIPKTKVSLNRIEEVLNKSSFEKNNDIVINDVSSIFLNKTSFSYNDTKILDNLTLTINKNENIGIIGPTGSGKSTICKLIAKEYQAKDNSITINNYDINNLTKSSIVTNITYSPQTKTILTGTIIENISFSNPSISKEEISKIIYSCNLIDFISKKEEKLNYKLTSNGNNISEGQKQRICLARALAAPTNILILDEPYSAIDYKNEKEIITNINNYYKNKTIITLSQRISSIMNCKKIYVINKGKIINEGTHTYLLDNCDLYKQMYIQQKEVLEYDI